MSLSLSFPFPARARLAWDKIASTTSVPVGQTLVTLMNHVGVHRACDSRSDLARTCLPFTTWLHSTSIVRVGAVRLIVELRRQAESCHFSSHRVRRHARVERWWA